MNKCNLFHEFKVILTSENKLMQWFSIKGDFAPTGGIWQYLETFFGCHNLTSSV